MGRIHRAARMGKYNEVADYLMQGDDVNAMSIRHASALTIAVQEGHVDIVKLLLKAGADVNLAYPNGRTALHLAACKGFLPIVRILVAAGANLNGVSRAESTPAIEAAYFNHREVVLFLQQQGADMTFRDLDGKTALDWLEVGGVFAGLAQRFPDEFGIPNGSGERPLAKEDRAADVRKAMASGLSADEYAARHGRRILVRSYGYFRFQDPEVESWAHRLAEILFTPGLLDECEERYLTGDALEEARKCRARRERHAQRMAKTSARINPLRESRSE